ncbi:MAG TPA: TetR/AcrR family transcriptional regulator [Verrucomicrobiae bacterium]|nr:TetR/AcrR family transcriptional regulator [Verrucomicrobiae bacterium]
MRARPEAAVCYNVSVASHSLAAPRRLPQQKRGRRRVAGFLHAAASVITEEGYERATMSAIADRAHSCIGSLYQFFPNKRSVAEALCEQYISEIEQSWAVLGRQAGELATDALACRLARLQIEIVHSHPALLELLDLPPTRHTPKRRELIRTRIAAVLTAHKPRMSKTTALRVASVVQQISRGMLSLYARTSAEEKSAIIEEFKSVLTGYLAPKLKP